MQQMRLRFPGGAAKALTLSYDDGVEQDKKLIELMRAHGVKGTFNLNSALFAPEGTKYPADRIHRRMSRNDCLATYAGDDIEVAVHGAVHAFLESLAPSAVMADVLDDRRNLEKMFGRIVRGMAYAFGTYSDEAVNVLKLAGIVYSRTTETRLNFNIPTDWLRMGATCHHKNAALTELADKFTKDTPNREPWLFYLWGHAYEFEADNNWSVIERFLDTVGGHEDIWYATNIQIYDYVEAYHRLVFSADQSIAFNPTSTDIWAMMDGETVRIPAGRAISR